MDKLDDSGTTLDGGTEQTRELMHDSEKLTVVPKPVKVQTALDRCPPISDERKRKIEAESKRKMDYMQVEYWRMRNGKQEFMRCPYCVTSRHGRKRNYEGFNMCCNLFMKAFGAIIDRQSQVDVAASHVRNLNKVGLVN